MGITPSAQVKQVYWEDVPVEEEWWITDLWILVRSMNSEHDLPGEGKDVPTWALEMSLTRAWQGDGLKPDSYYRSALVQKNITGCVSCEIWKCKEYAEMEPYVYGRGKKVYRAWVEMEKEVVWRTFRDNLSPFSNYASTPEQLVRKWCKELTSKPLDPEEWEGTFPKILQAQQFTWLGPYENQSLNLRGWPKEMISTAGFCWDKIDRKETITNCWIALRTMDWSLGANHWSVVLSLANGKYVCLQKHSKGCVERCVFSTLKSASLQTWGSKESRVRLSNYGSCKVSWKDFELRINPYSGYTLGPFDCQTYARYLVSYLVSKSVGTFPIENGPEFYP